MMRKPLYTISLYQWKIFDQLVLEELLLRCTKDNFFVWNKETPSKAIVMGFSAKPPELIEIDKVKRDNVPVIRRFTGGGTVIVDEETLFGSLIMNDKDASTRPYPREIMAWTEPIYAQAFLDSMIDKEAEKFRLREHDYVVGDKKIGGNAQSIIKDRWIHHTSFLWNFNPENMEYLSLPKKRPEYRQSRKHTDFLLPLSTHLQSVELLERNIFSQLSQLYDLIPIPEKNLLKKIEQLKQENPKHVPKTVWEVL